MPYSYRLQGFEVNNNELRKVNDLKSYLWDIFKYNYTELAQYNNRVNNTIGPFKARITASAMTSGSTSNVQTQPMQTMLVPILTAWNQTTEAARGDFQR